MRYPTRLADAVRALRQCRRLLEHDTWSREQLEAHQARALEDLRRHAAAHSPFWRDRLSGELPPVLHKETLMAHFDEAVADPRLRLSRLEEHLASLGHEDALLDKDFRVLATGGATGRRGVFAYSRAEWRLKLANALRAQRYAGIETFPRRRVAAISARSAVHIASRYAMSADIGWHEFHRLFVEQPIEELLAALGSLQPDVITGYPSVVAILAQAQLEGRLRISPSAVSTTSELRTEGMEAAIRDAWPDARVMDMYATTEGGIIGADCGEGTGMHLFEDLAIFENVDGRGAPVPEGEPGAFLLITDLFALAQPKLRYAISDSVVLSSEPCPCGRPYRRVVEIAGRSDDILDLPAAAGGTVRVHPLVLRSPMATQAGVLQYQVVHDHAGLHVRVVPRVDADASLVEREARAAVDAALQAAGAAVAVDVRAVAELERQKGHAAKLRVVVSKLG